MKLPFYALLAGTLALASLTNATLHGFTYHISHNTTTTTTKITNDITENLTIFIAIANTTHAPTPTSTSAPITTPPTTSIPRLPSWTTTLLCYDVLLAAALLWCWACGCFWWMRPGGRMCGVGGGEGDEDEDRRRGRIRGPERAWRRGTGLEGEMRRIGLV